VKAFHVLYTDTMNLALERGGYAARLHPDKLIDRGIDREPEPRLRPSDSNALKYAYRVTPAMQQVFDHRLQRTQHAESELSQAQQYWQGRKLELGLTRALAPSQQLDRITQAWEHAISHAPERMRLAQLVEQEQTLTRSVDGLQHYVEQVQQARAAEAQWVPQVGNRGWEEMLEHERVLAAGNDHGLPGDAEAEQLVGQLTRFLDRLSREEEQSQGRALNIRLHERGRDRGMSW
jgi:hypothetical protein